MLSEVASARVHLVLPKDTLFADERKAAKAAVMVRLKRGSELSNIDGVVQMVASAVEGLEPENVSVIDLAGKLLSKSIRSGDGRRTEIELEYRAAYEKELVEKVKTIIVPLVGREKVQAMASVEVDFDSTEQTEETYDPNTSVVASQERTAELIGSAPSTGGIPGAQSNQGAAQGSPGTVPERTRETEATDFRVSKRTRHTIKPKGQIRRISVAVLVDHRTIYSKAEDGTVSQTSESRTPEQLESMRNMVLAAVGFDPDRGDIVTLENVAFFSDVPPEEELPPLPWYVKWQSYLLPAIKYTAFLALFLMVYFVLFRPISKRVFEGIALQLPAAPRREAHSLPAEPEAKVLSGAPSTVESTAAEPETVRLDEPMEAPLPDEPLLSLEEFDTQIEREFIKDAQNVGMEGRKYMVLKRKLSDHALKEPEEISQLIRSWMYDEEV